MKKIELYVTVGLMASVTVLWAVYCIVMMIELPYMLDLKIFATLLSTSMLALFTWAIYDGMKDCMEDC